MKKCEQEIREKNISLLLIVEIPLTGSSVMFRTISGRLYANCYGLKRIEIYNDICSLSI